MLTSSLLLCATLDAATFTVTTTADSGAGSLRQAILEANANPGADEIGFSIPGSGVQTINPLTPPPIITDIVHINGYSQPGAAAATESSPAAILIEISGALLPGGPDVNGITLAAGSSGSSIRGLSINRFKRVVGGTGHAVTFLPGSGSHWVAGNYLNVAPDGNTIFDELPSFGDGIADTGSGNNIIGYNPSGPNSANPSADRNVISGSGSGRNGLLVFGTSPDNQIRGNYIGTDATGTLDRGNALDGVQVQSAGNMIENNLVSGNERFGIFTAISLESSTIRGNFIGTDVSGTLDLGNSSAGIQLQARGNVVEKNLISANGSAGIRIAAFGNGTVIGNRIGTDISGTLGLGNTSAGVHLASGTRNFIGGPDDGDGNTIAFNSVGVLITGASAANAILGNSIFSNDNLGIDIGGEGVTPNDPLDSDVGANNFQNFPVINGEKSLLNPALVQVCGVLDSKPSQQYLIQIFSSALADPSGYGEGHQLVGKILVSTDATGHAQFHFPAKLYAPIGSIISATATDLLTGDTSEFSKWENLNQKGSPTAYEHAAGAAGRDGDNGDIDDLTQTAERFAAE